MIRAYRLHTEPDGNSHVARGFVNEDKLVETRSIHFKETPPHSSYEWHDAPHPQYVITLAGVLEFTTVGGETFIIHPGEVLLAEDNIGSGHKWRLINDEPWKRAYVVFKEGADAQFVPGWSFNHFKSGHRLVVIAMRRSMNRNFYKGEGRSQQ